MKTRVWYDSYASPVGSAPTYVHPEKHMDDLGQKLGFTVFASLPQSMMDGWEFWVAHEGSVEWPHYITPRDWKEPK